MGIGFDLPGDSTSSSGPGRPEVPLTVAYVRDLTEADLLTLSTTKLQSIKPTREEGLTRVTQRHHALARMLAVGTVDDITAARTLGMNPQTVSMLKKDPTFQELLTHYSKVQEAAFVDVAEQMAATSSTAIALIQEKLEGSDPVSLTELIRVAELTLDRTGHGPTKTVRNENPSDVIDALRKLREQHNADAPKGSIRARPIPDLES